MLGALWNTLYLRTLHWAWYSVKAREAHLSALRALPGNLLACPRWHLWPLWQRCHPGAQERRNDCLLHKIKGPTRGKRSRSTGAPGQHPVGEPTGAPSDAAWTCGSQPRRDTEFNHCLYSSFHYVLLNRLFYHTVCLPPFLTKIHKEPCIISFPLLCRINAKSEPKEKWLSYMAHIWSLFDIFITFFSFLSALKLVLSASHTAINKILDMLDGYNLYIRHACFLYIYHLIYHQKK